MNKLTLALLLICPLAVLCFKPMKKPRPKIDREANMRRVFELYELTKDVPGLRTREPVWPMGYPSDPDSGSWEGQQ